MKPSHPLAWAIFLSLSMLLFVTFRAYAPDEEYRPVLQDYGPISGSSVCASIIGSYAGCEGHHQGGDDYWGWDSSCWVTGNGDWLCQASTDCPGTNAVVTCQGEYEAQSDGSGVMCKDTGSDYWETSWCN